MYLQPEFYHHIISGRAGDAAPLLARIVLHLGYNAELYPIKLEDIKKIKLFARPDNSCGLSEFFLIEFLRSNMMENATPWRTDQVERLRVFAESPIPSIIQSRNPIILNS